MSTDNGFVPWAVARAGRSSRLRSLCLGILYDNRTRIQHSSVRNRILVDFPRAAARRGGAGLELDRRVAYNAYHDSSEEDFSPMACRLFSRMDVPHFTTCEILP